MAVATRFVQSYTCKRTKKFVVVFERDGWSLIVEKERERGVIY